MLVFELKVTSQTKVPELEYSRFHHKDIGRLDVAVHHALAVHVAQSTAHLLKILPRTHLRQRGAGLQRLLQHAAEVAPLCELHGHVQLVVLNEGIEVLYDVGVAERLEELDLVEALVAALRVHHLEDLDLLEGHLLAVTLPSRVVHDRELAASN
eukprot:CAMPEP_0185175282 /NCGR_PEP_ID=MMETSP1139-20130426/26525_1 /TAXON_ID=298111 /ORGANISM="Pavlova sp., Strain CCMP459" /LENGTH=153 /DNA_ID=CAMNT_0027741015 /DNA_START=869 /DNA_END=1329 /DNA_ORIENTATION=+